MSSTQTNQTNNYFTEAFVLSKDVTVDERRKWGPEAFRSLPAGTVIFFRSEPKPCYFSGEGKLIAYVDSPFGKALSLHLAFYQPQTWQELLVQRFGEFFPADLPYILNQLVESKILLTREILEAAIAAESPHPIRSLLAPSKPLPPPPLPPKKITNHVKQYLLIAAAALIAWQVFFSPRYELQTTSRGVNYKIDTRSGKVWVQSGGLSWSEVSDSRH
jgi:hypothetical protein